MSFYEFDADVYEDPALPLYSSICELGPKEAGFLHWHDAVELLYCMEGEGVAVSGNQQLRLAPGEMAVIPSGRLHDFYTEETPCKYGVLLMAPELTACQDLPNRPVQAFLSDPEAAGQVEGILRELQEQRPFYRAEIRGRIARLFVYLQRTHPGEEAEDTCTDGRKQEVTKAVIAYIRRHFAEPVTVDGLCAAVCFSRSYVCHAFKEVTGKTVIEYLRMVRCSSARALLADGRYSVTECARQSGFQTPSYFSRVYRQEMGVPPSSHR